MMVVPFADVRWEWNEFVDRHPLGWWWDTAEWLTYMATRPHTTNLSFAVVDKHGLAAVCPLLLEGDEFAGESEPLPWPLRAENDDPYRGQRALYEVHVEILRLAKEHKVRRVRFRKTPLTDVTPEISDTYTDISWPSQVIDLTRTAVELRWDLNHGAKQRANKGMRLYRVEQEEKSVEKFHALHLQEAGRETRPQVTWDAMDAWLRSGHALLVEAMDQRLNKPAGYAYFLCYKQKAYMGMSAYDKTLPNAAQAVVWYAILWLKEHGYTALEMGWLERAGDDDKDKSIAEFKQSFGGKALPVVACEKVFG